MPTRMTPTAAILADFSVGKLLRRFKAVTGSPNHLALCALPTLLALGSVTSAATGSYLASAPTRSNSLPSCDHGGGSYAVCLFSGSVVRLS